MHICICLDNTSDSIDNVNPHNSNADEEIMRVIIILTILIVWLIRAIILVMMTVVIMVLLWLSRWLRLLSLRLLFKISRPCLLFMGSV